MHDAVIGVPFAGCVVGRKLGSGYWGTVYLVRNTRTGEELACKFLPRGKQIVTTCENVERELSNLRQLQGHPNIIALKQVFLTPTHLGIAMELAAGGELHKLVVQAGRLSEAVACYFFHQLISGLAWCHRNGVCHRDLKLENSLLDRPVPAAAGHDINLLLALRPQLKICDFGYSKSSVFDSKPHSMVGTPVYMAPEVLCQPNYDGAAADVWSCGVLLYVMLVGAYPFEDPADPKEDIRKTIDRILAIDYHIPSKVQLSGECRDLLSRIFVKDPAARITLPQIQQHPWLHPDLAAAPQGGMPSLPGFRLLQSEADIRRMIIDAAAVDHEQEQLDLLKSSGHIDAYMDKFTHDPGVFTDSRGHQASELNIEGRFIDPDIALELGEEFLMAHWPHNSS